jgi:hypothetical protein
MAGAEKGASLGPAVNERIASDLFEPVPLPVFSTLIFSSLMMHYERGEDRGWEAA